MPKGVYLHWLKKFWTTPLCGIQTLRESEWGDSSGCVNWPQRCQRARFQCRVSAKIQQNTSEGFTCNTTTTQLGQTANSLTLHTAEIKIMSLQLMNVPLSHFQWHTHIPTHTYTQTHTHLYTHLYTCSARTHTHNSLFSYVWLSLFISAFISFFFFFLLNSLRNEWLCNWMSAFVMA